MSQLVSGNAALFTTSNGSNPNTAAPTWSLGAGVNRGVVLAFSHKQSATGASARIASAVSVDGVAFTKIINRAAGADPNWAHAEIWACNEASGLSIGSNPTISITYASSGTGMAQGVITTVTDCDQNLANWTFNATDGQLANTTLNAALSGFTSGSLVIGSYCDNAGLASVNCAASGGDATTEFTSSDVTFNSSARAVQFYATSDANPAFVVQRTSSSGGVYCALAVAGIPNYVASGVALDGTGSAQASSATATLTTPALSITLRDIDSNALKNAVTYANVHVVNASSRGAIAASLTSKTTSASGVMVLRAPGISTIGATYDVAGWNSDGTDRFHASAVCADL